jgi:hypothetical protein
MEWVGRIYRQEKRSHIAWVIERSSIANERLGSADSQNTTDWLVLYRNPGFGRMIRKFGYNRRSSEFDNPGIGPRRYKERKKTDYRLRVAVKIIFY